MPHGFQVIRGNVVNVIDRVEREVERRSRAVRRTRQWREMTIKEDDGREHTYIGEVLDRVRHGDDVAVVLAPTGREPIALADLSGQFLQIHGSADPDTREGSARLSTAVIIAFFGALPGLFLYFAFLVVLFPEMDDSFSATALKFYPLILFPVSWWVSSKVTRWAHDRAKRMYGEVELALVAAGITSETPVRDQHGTRQVGLA